MKMTTEKALSVGKGILIILGVLTIFEFCIEWGMYWLDKDYRENQQEVAYNEKMGSAYNLGMLWGKENAMHYEMEDEVIIKVNTKEKAEHIARELLASRYLDYQCWGPEDYECAQLPTEDDLSSWFDTKDRDVGNMPILAFESGFVDSFLVYYGY